MNNTEHVIIIGAPRSGTNMLRDILTSFNGVETWPCDEINYIWRHGNVLYPSDEIPVSRATDSVKRYIQKAFELASNRYQAGVLVEKTCANSLRVPFVDSIVPDAKYIFIVRDGVDATGSAKKRWTSKIDMLYIWEKVKFVPILDLPIYAIRYLWARLFRLFSKDDRLAFWGPELDNMNDLLKERTLNEVCAIQWKHCVDSAESAFSNMSPDKVIKTRYEDFVSNPEYELERILNFVDIKVSANEVKKAVKSVSCKSLGRGRSSLGEKEVEHLESVIYDTLERHNYT